MSEEYYEIEYDSSPFPGVGKFVLKAQKIKPEPKDEIRTLFERMRKIARDIRGSYYGKSNFYNKKVREENSKIFYKQGMFMKDFEDHYEETVPYSEYFPCYQMMGYGQLRTYFTWRTKVRKGVVESVPVSYGYLYIYELLNNIGVSDPQEGLEQLLCLWKKFREYEPSMDKYLLKWVKDYHIYYDLSFPDFIKEQNLSDQYPDILGGETMFSMLCAMSKYDIRKSRFYTGDRKELIENCFLFLMDRLNLLFSEHGLDLREFLFPDTRARRLWTPFQNALFYPWRQQRDRRVVFSEKEIYVCSDNRWMVQDYFETAAGKQMIGYFLKKMESVLRQAVHYQYKITAKLEMIDPVIIKECTDAGIFLEESVAGFVMEYYREATKIVVSVDQHALEKIRREALSTQEKLLVPEEGQKEIFRGSFSYEHGHSELEPQKSPKSPLKTAEKKFILKEPLTEKMPEAENAGPGNTQEEDPWRELKQALTQTEQEALKIIVKDISAIRAFADTHSVMLEVLLDGMNEKAADIIGDSILDEEGMVYGDYIEQVKEMMG